MKRTISGFVLCLLSSMVSAFPFPMALGDDLNAWRPFLPSTYDEWDCRVVFTIPKGYNGSFDRSRDYELWFNQEPGGMALSSYAVSLYGKDEAEALTEFLDKKARRVESQHGTSWESFGVIHSIYELTSDAWYYSASRPDSPCKPSQEIEVRKKPDELDK